MTAVGSPAGPPRALDLARLDGGTRAAVSCAVQDLDHLGRFTAAARALVERWFTSPEPDDLRTLAGLIDAADAAAVSLRGRLSDLIAAEDVDRLDGEGGASAAWGPADGATP